MYEPARAQRRIWYLGPLVAVVVAGCRGPAVSPSATSVPAPEFVGRPASGEVRVGRIQDEAALVPGGAAENAVGDWVLANHVARFVVHDAEQRSDVYLMNGGALVDADLWREEGESWDLIQDYAPAVDLGRIMEAERIAVVAGTTAGATEAVLEVDGYLRSLDILEGVLGMDLAPRDPDFRVTTRYRLRPDLPVLEITTTLHYLGDRERTVAVGDALFPSDHFGDPFALPAGFDRRALDGELSLIGAVGERNELTLAFLPVTGSFTIDAPADLVVQGDFAPLFFRTATCRLRRDQRCSWHRLVVVASSPAAARAAAARYLGRSPGTPVTGSVVAAGTGSPVAGARVFLTAANAPEQVLDLDMTDAQGSFTLYAPPGVSRATVWARPTDPREAALHPRVVPPAAFAEGYLPAAPVTVAVPATAPLRLELPPPAELVLTWRDEAGRLLPGKLTLRKADGTTSPTSSVFGEHLPYGDVEKVVWQAHGGTVTTYVPPGTYELVAAYGLEYELDRRAPVELASGTRHTFTFTLTRAVDTTGWVACDTHIHTADSNHGRTTRTDRLITIVAEGLDCAAITDHDRIMDYEPLNRFLGLTDRLFTFPGVEVSTFTRGHINPYPLTPDPTRPNNGAVPWWEPGWSVDKLFTWMREMGARIIQINHGGDGGYFDLTGYDPATGRGGAEYSEAFDAMELVNGKRPFNWRAERTIAFSFWNRGKRKTIVGVSDSHHRIPEPGYGRTYLQAAPELDSLMAAFLEMRAFVSGGPWIEASVAGATYGAVVQRASPRIRVRVVAPSWMHLTEVHILWNGDTWETLAPANEGEPSRLDTEVALPSTADGWVAVEVLGDSDLFPVYPGAIPYAMTNPIFVDVDGDGWRPPIPPE